MSITFEKANPNELARYFAVHAMTIRSLTLAIDHIAHKLLKDEYNSGSARLRDEQHFAKLKSQKAMAKSAKIAFEVSQTTISPPKPSLFKEATAISNKVYELIKKNKKIEDIILLATEAFKLFNKIQSVDRI